MDAEQVKLELLLTDARIKSQDIDHSPAGASLTAEPSVVVVLATPAFPARSEKLMEKGTAPTGSLLVTGAVAAMAGRGVANWRRLATSR